MKSECQLSEDMLKKLGFAHCDPCFENNTMPYFAKNAVVLLYNKTDKRNFLIGHGSYNMQHQKYFVSTFRWISTIEELVLVYRAITGEWLTRKTMTQPNN